MDEQAMEHYIRQYFAACNSGLAQDIASYFEPEGIHYFPPGMYGGPFRGAQAIGRAFAEMVQDLGSYWTVDTVLCHERKQEAVIEWTHFKKKSQTILRGCEWYRFSPNGRIQDIRAYYASPQDPTNSRLELFGFDYEHQGYPITFPEVKK